MISTRRTKKPGNAPLNQTKPSGISLNGKDLHTVREICLDHYDAEYLYLRENELVQFDVDVKMDLLRVLDLSINDIGGAVDFLDRTPHLRHLYMTGNKIETLQGICNFPSLETLCLSDNAISSFEGLTNLPSLRVLSLNFNNIASFEFFPSLPNLHTLNLVGNPVTDVPSYRSMAIAINCPDLVSIDGNPVQEEERAAVTHYQGKIVYCIREGFIVEGNNVDEAADRFLLEIQREREASKVLQLCAIRMNPAEEGSSTITEGETVTLSLCMQDIRSYSERTAEVFHSRYLYPVIFKVSGEATEVFAVGSMNNWNDPIELERCEENGEIYFHTTLYLPAGDYEYRYIVDGVEKVSDTNRITSKYNQGFCNLYRVTELETQEEDQDTILHIRWMRSNANGVFEVIEDENALTYTPSTLDIGGCLRTEVLAYIHGEFSFLYFDISSPVMPAPPSCPHLEIKGKTAEGAVLMAEADYVGGVEGSSSLQWFRVSPSGEATAIEQRDPWAGYKLTREDIGCRVRVEFTPVRNDWVAGEPRTAETDVIVQGEPECESIKIIGNLTEGSELEVEVVYSGGQEGDSFYQWLRKADNSDDYIPIEGQNATRYVTTVDDVSKCLAVEYTPVNSEGKEGETCRCVLENPIEAQLPVVQNLAVAGQMTEGHVLTLEYEYHGGHFGAHMIQWYRKGRGKALKTGQANSAFHTLGPKDVGCGIEVSLTPVRSDGVKGAAVHAQADGVVSAGPPTVKFLSIEGQPKEGAELTLKVDYSGGQEGSSGIVWEIQDPDTQEYATVAEGVAHYTVKRKDQGKTLRVVYSPVREDGACGEEKTFTVDIFGEVQPPTPPPQEEPSEEEEEAPVAEQPAEEEVPPHTDERELEKEEPHQESAAEAQPEEEEAKPHDSDSDSGDDNKPAEKTVEEPAEEPAKEEEVKEEDPYRELSPTADGKGESAEKEKEPEPEPEGAIKIDLKKHDSDEDSEDEL
ncbi:leucine-richprotein [Angomonas deanei]|nr:leucine-richprotein [Angomonas deanei]|eukprot:EPY34459.1 leucine-richprotein [Angomonas deanei]